VRSEAVIRTERDSGLPNIDYFQADRRWLERSVPYQTHNRTKFVYSVCMVVHLKSLALKLYSQNFAHKTDLLKSA
jgi:hypothetical protein